MNFINALTELDKLYESVETDKIEEAATGFRLTGAQMNYIEDVACEYAKKDCDKAELKELVAMVDPEITAEDLSSAADNNKKFSRNIRALQAHMKAKNFKTFGDFAKSLEEVKESLKEDVEDEVEIEIEDDEAESVVLECVKCGALVIKENSEIIVDDESALANIEEECAYCGEAAGFKAIGSFEPYDVQNDVEGDDDAEVEEVVEESFDNEEEAAVEESLLDVDIPVNVKADGNTVSVGAVNK